MARLPNPGSDDGVWGTILNEFLSVSLSDSGALNGDTVDTTAIVDASVIEAKLSTAVRTKLNTVATNGREIELQGNSTHIQWRYVGDPTWTDLIALANITGPQGPAGSATPPTSYPQTLIVTTGDEDRPLGSDVVFWVGGATKPTNMAASDVWFQATVVSDATAPSVPSGLTLGTVASTSFSVSWTASTDAVGVTGYEVFVDGVSYATPSATSQAVLGRTAGTDYSVTVRARDAAGNWSAQSSALVVHTADASSDVYYPSATLGNPVSGYNDGGTAGFTASMIFATHATVTAKGARWYATSETAGVIVRAALFDIANDADAIAQSPVGGTMVLEGWNELIFESSYPLVTGVTYEVKIMQSGTQKYTALGGAFPVTQEPLYQSSASSAGWGYTDDITAVLNPSNNWYGIDVILEG